MKKERKKNSRFVYGIEQLVRVCHRKAIYAVYSFVGFRVEVYLRHNKPCKNEWGDFYLSCYIKPKGGLDDIEGERHEFFNYADFRKFRLTLKDRFKL